MKQIELSKTGIKHRGKVATVSDEDADLDEFNWKFNPKLKSGYAIRQIWNKGKPITVSMHRVIMQRMLPRPLEVWEEVDHINEDKLDNQRHNLRITDSVGQAANRGAQSNNKSGIKGVFWDKDLEKWRAQICVNGKKIHLGVFTNTEDASAAYLNAAKLYFKTFANDGTGNITLKREADLK